MIFWVKLKDSKVSDRKNGYIRIEDEWQKFFYIASNNKSNLEQIIQNDGISSLIRSYEDLKE